MNCTKCGKEIPDGEKKVCDECERNVIESIVAEEKEECKTKKVKVKKEKAPKKEKNKKISIKEMVICGIAIVFVVAIVIGICAVINSNKSGNTIGNIRNYGYAVESDNWIYYLAPNEDSSQIGIFKIRNNGKDKKQLYMSEIDIVSLNVYKDHIYFIGNSTETYLENDELDNKIYRMKTNGTELEVLNDNELNNDCYEIYVINNKIYYIGLNAEICEMDLNGANKNVLADNGTGFLGINQKYIIYNSEVSQEGDYVTYIMNIDGSDAKPIIEGRRLYSVSIEGKYVYYSDEDKKICRTKIGSGEEEVLYDNLKAYNLNTNDGYAYYLNYLDAENSNYTICLFRVKLDGTTKTPEILKELEEVSSFIDVVGDWVIYMDNSEEAAFINLVNKNGNGKEIELYRLDYEAFYEALDYSGEEVEADEGVESTDGSEEEIANDESGVESDAE